MRALLIALLPALTLALGAPAAADGLTAQQLLGAIDVPLSPALLERYGLDQPALARVLGDQKQRRYVRLRALSGLGILGSPAARDQVIQALRADADEVVRAEAAVVLARAWAQGGDQPALQALRAVQAKQPPLRLARTLDEELARLAQP